MRKTTLLFTLCSLVFSSFQLSAQLKIGGPDPFFADLKKIISSFPDHFKNYRGDIIVANAQSTDYRCTMKVSGAEEMWISSYSGKKEIWTWQAIMYSTEEFSKAKQKFKNYFSQLNGLTVNGLRLQGDYEAPEEEKKFTSIHFQPEGGAAGWDKLRVELLMQFSPPMEWKIRVTVYDQDKKDREESGVY